MLCYEDLEGWDGALGGRANRERTYIAYLIQDALHSRNEHNVIKQLYSKKADETEQNIYAFKHAHLKHKWGIPYTVLN